MAQPPPLATGAAQGGLSALDQALESIVQGDFEGSLRASVPLAKAALDNAPALLALGQALGGLGRQGLSRTALELAYEQGKRSNLLLAAAACCWLRGLKQDVEPKLKELGALYCHGAPTLSEKPPAPPALKGKEPAPLAATVTGKDLFAQVEQVLEYARAAADSLSEPEPATLPEQTLLSSLPAPVLTRFLSLCQADLKGDGELVIEQGESGDAAFLLARGEVQVTRVGGPGEADTELARLGTGALIGEMALLARAPRAARIVTRRPAVLLHVHRDGLDALAGEDPAVAKELVLHTRTRMMQNLLSTSPLLQAVTADERGPLMKRLSLRSFEADQRLIEQGQPPDGLHLIASGQVRVVHRDPGQDLHLAKLGPGRSVGEIALILRRSANAEVTADCPTVTLFMAKETLMGLIDEDPRLLAQLYALAVSRDEETSRAVSEEAASIDEFVPV